MNCIKRIASISAVFASICLLTLSVSVADLHAAVIATLRGVIGQVDILAQGQLPAKAAKDGDQISNGDLVRTKTGGTTEVVYQDGTVLRVAQRSRIDIGEHFSGNKPDSSEVKLIRGKVRAIVDLKQIKTSGPKRFEIRTANAIAGVRGTDFIVTHERALTNVLVNTGEVYVYNIFKDGQIVNLTPGTITTVYGRNRPTPPRPALESDKQRMSSSNGKAGAGGTGSSADATNLAGDTTLTGQPTTGTTSNTFDSLTKTATQGISGTVAPPPPSPPPPASTTKTGSVTATW
jgi:hypothetical protein